MSSWPNPEELIRLAKQDPEALEALRLREVESVIQGAPPSLQKRLRGLQFQIDAKRRTSKSALGACMAISHMMLDSVYALNDALNGAPSTASQAAEVLPFTKQFGRAT
jgi:hypothetical protein